MNILQKNTKICEPFGTKNIDEEVDEGIQKLKYTISKGNNKGYFAIHENDGQITVKKTGRFGLRNAQRRRN